MNRARIFNWCIVLIFLFISISVLAETQERSEVSSREKWKLEDIYESDAMWKEAKDELAGRLDEIVEYKGKVNKSAGGLLGCLKLDTEFSKELSRLYNYAMMKSDEDTRDSKYLGMRQELEQIMTDYQSKASFMLPEIAAMNKKKIDKFISREAGLEVYKMPLYDMSKAGVIGLMRSLANGYGKDGIRVNAICPGVTVTEFHEKKAAERGVSPEELRAGLDGHALLGKGAEPYQIASVIYFLSSADASHITGQVITVDGGLTAMSHPI